MMKKMEEGGQACTRRHYVINQSDLPLSCPPRDLRVWDAHPRVYLPIETAGTVICPYCSAVYVLKESISAEN